MINHVGDVIGVVQLINRKSNKNIIVGLILGCICLFTSISANSETFGSLIGRIYSFALSFIIGFFGGSMFWTMLGFSRLTSELGKEVQIKTSIFDSKTSLLRTASSVLWKVSLLPRLSSQNTGITTLMPTRN